MSPLLLSLTLACFLSAMTLGSLALDIRSVGLDTRGSVTKSMVAMLSVCALVMTSLGLSSGERVVLFDPCQPRMINMGWARLVSFNGSLFTFIHSFPFV